MPAGKAFRMEALSNGIQAFVLDAVPAASTLRCYMALPAELAVKVTFLLDKANVNQRTAAVGSRTLEVLRTVELRVGCYEWATA